MASFAKLDNNNIVIEVHALDNHVTANSENVEDENIGIEYLTKIHKYSNWKQTSYNTIGGTHKLGGTPFRKNFAGIGYTYDAVKDAFIPPTPFPSWIFNEGTANWDPPVTYPSSTTYIELNDGVASVLSYVIEWNEAGQKWTAFKWSTPKVYFDWNPLTENWDSV